MNNKKDIIDIIKAHRILLDLINSDEEKYSDKVVINYINDIFYLIDNLSIIKDTNVTKISVLEQKITCYGIFYNKKLIFNFYNGGSYYCDKLSPKLVKILEKLYYSNKNEKSYVEMFNKPMIYNK